MKKIITALLCALAVFALASCSPAGPDPGSQTKQYLDEIPTWLHGKWQTEAGAYWFITEDDVVFYSSRNAETGMSYNREGYIDYADGTTQYAIKEYPGPAHYEFIFKYPVNNTIEVGQWQDADSKFHSTTYSLVEE